jgi:hypothetical protein
VPERKKREHQPSDGQSQGGANRGGKPTGEGISDQPAGANSAGYIEGVGGAGGASGAGAVRVKTDDIGDVSGIDADAGGSDTGDVHETTSGKSGSASGYRRSTSGNSGIPGMTRGTFHETIPDAEDDRDNPPPKNTQKRRQ